MFRVVSIWNSYKKCIQPVSWLLRSTRGKVAKPKLSFHPLNSRRNYVYNIIWDFITHFCPLFAQNREVSVVEETKKVVESDDTPVVASEEPETTTPTTTTPAAVEEPETTAPVVEKEEETPAVESTVEAEKEKVTENGNGEKAESVEEPGKLSLNSEPDKNWIF